MITTDATGRCDAPGLPAETRPVEISHCRGSSASGSDGAVFRPQMPPDLTGVATTAAAGPNASASILGGNTGQRSVTPPRVGGLFAGAGMLDHAVHHTLGATPAWFVENDPAASWGVHVEAHPADWDRHGRAAGPLRNAHMIGLGADICLAFPLGESRGTRHCMGLAQAAGITVIDCVNGGEPR